jgi:hypothetical protein
MSTEQAPTGGPEPLSGAVRLLVAAANFAGQGRAWADAAATLPWVSATSFAVEDPSGLTLPAEHSVDAATFADPDWSAAHEEWVRTFTHVLIEAGRPVLGQQHGLDAYGDNDVLTEAGVSVGMVAHGSDVRRPDRHVEREPDSPFLRVGPKIRATRQKYADRIAPLIDACPAPFVSTPDLLEDVPNAAWLPVVVDVRRWDHEPLLGRAASAPPIVAHVPSNAMWKGTELVTPVLDQLAADGTIIYRPISRVPQAQMPEVIGSTEIVLDQFALGSYGVAAVEAMAAARVVVGHVRPEVRAHVLSTTGYELPIVQARAGEVADVLAELARDPERCRVLGEAGRAFAHRFHSGAFSARVLEGYLTGAAASRVVGGA